MKIYILQLWDFRSANGVQRAYPRLDAAQDAIRDFKSLGGIEPVRIRTYHVHDTEKALLSLLEWGASDVVPTLPEEMLVYDRDLTDQNQH